MSKWPSMPLATAIQHRKDFIQIDDLADYKRCRVQLHAQGIVLRDTVPGAEIKTKKQQVCKAGDFLVAEIDAKVGGFGIVPDTLDGAIVSSHYFLFGIDQDILNRRFLDFYIRTPAFREQVAAQGSTNYAAIRPNDVLGYKIPLPQLPEQRRIVARIESLAAKIEEARCLRKESGGETKSLAHSAADAVYKDLSNRYGCKSLSEMCQSITDGDHLTPLFSEEGVKFIFVGNVSSGQLHFDGCKHVADSYFATLKPQRIPRRGDILYSAVGATLGVPALVETDEPFCFQRHVAILKPNPTMLLPKFGWHMLQSRTVFDRAWASTTGSAQPTVPLHAIRELEIPAVPVKDQRRIVTYLDGLQAKVDQMKKLQAETTAELAALLPSILDKAFKGEL